MKIDPYRLHRSYLTWIVVLMLVFAGCATPLEKGWKFFGEGKYKEAREAWSKEHPDLTKRIDSAEKIIEYYNKLLDAEKANNHPAVVKLADAIMEEDKYADKEWITLGPNLAQYMEHAKAAHKKAQRIINGKIQNAFDSKYECGKEQFQFENYQNALDCFMEAKKIASANSHLNLSKMDMDDFIAAAEQAIEIARQIEEEIKAFEAAKRKQIEEERKLEEERRKKAEEEIRLAKEAEKKRLKELEEKRRREEEKKRKWIAFLKKGKPLRPLVAAIGIPSTGHSKLAKGSTEKWQGGAHFPGVKKLKLRPEDVYSLEIVIPRKFEMTYLRNYANSKGNMMKIPQTIGQKKHYYSEGYKGGRFYTEVKNTRDSNEDYEISGVIYKIPVVH